MAAHWQTATGSVAEYMNSLPKVVCSHTLHTAGWNNTTVVRGHVAKEVATLKRQGSGNMFVFGSANLSKTLINEKLFDEYRLGIAPVIHGRGRLLFSDGLTPQGLQLLSASSVDRLRDPPLGVFSFVIWRRPIPHNGGADHGSEQLYCCHWFLVTIGGPVLLGLTGAIRNRRVKSKVEQTG